MADERLYILHVPSGRAVFIAKRFGLHWKQVPENIGTRLKMLLDLVSDENDIETIDDITTCFDGDERIKTILMPDTTDTKSNKWLARIRRLIYD